MDHTSWVRSGGLACLLSVSLPASGCGGDGGRGDEATDTGDPSGESGDEPTESGDQPTGDPLLGCDGVVLEQDGVLDLDIPEAAYVVVSGQVRVNGEPLPDAPGPRGQLRFEVAAKGEPTSAVQVLETIDDEDYTVVIPAGVVRVHYIPDAVLCAEDPGGPLPCSGGVVLKNIDIGESGVLDVDIPLIIVSGKVTQGGEELPGADGDRGHLEFLRESEVTATGSLDTSGAATYTLALFPGTYSVAFAGNPGLCAEGAAPVACNRGVVVSEVALMASGVLDVEVPRVEVSGAVTVNGAAVPDGMSDRGALRFDPVDPAMGVGLLAGSFAAEGPVTYAVSLIAGTYTVALAANPGQCAGAAPPTPCVGGPLLAAVDLTMSGALDVDIPMIVVGGDITREGAALPQEDGDRGSVGFAREGGDATAVALGTDGPIDYVLGVVPGTYALSYAANAGLCDGVTAPAMPCSSGPLQTLALNKDGVLDIDIPVVAVSGKVTRNGADLPNQVMDRGSVAFVGASGSLAVALGAADFSEYAVTLLPGTYDVAYTAASAECLTAPDNLMPCGGGPLVTGIALTSSGVLDVDVRAIEVSGAVTHGGAALPNLGDARGALRWTRVSAGGAEPLIGPRIDLGTDGPRQYAAFVMPGRWIVEHAANPALCEDTVPGFPCTDEVLVGCE